MGFMKFSEKKPESQKEEADVPKVSVVEGHEVELDDRLKSVVGGPMKFTVPEYTTVQNKKVKVSYAQIQDDYYYQLEFLTQVDMEPDELLTKIIAAFSLYLPKQIEKFIKLPDPSLNIPMYTIVVKKAAQLMNYKEFMEKKVVEAVITVCGAL